MSHTFLVFLNNAYVGSMTESFAHTVAATLCANVGDVLTLEQDWDGYGYEYDMNHTTHTYYHSESGLAMFSHTEGQSEFESSEEEIVRKVRTSAYSKRLSGFKYHRSDAKRCRGTSGAVAYMKRDMSRAARRVGKALIAEHI